MLAGFLKTSKPIHYLFFGISAVALFSFQFFKLFIEGDFSWGFIGYLLVFILYVAIFQLLVIKNELTQPNSYALFIMVLLIGSFYEFLAFNPIFIAGLLSLMGFRKIYSLRNQNQSISKVFDASVFIGIASLIYWPCVFFYALIYAAVLVHVAANYRNWVAPLIATLLVLLLYFTASLYFKIPYIEELIQRVHINLNWTQSDLGPYHILAISVIVIGFIGVLNFILNSSVDTQQRLRPNLKLSVLQLIIAVMVYFLFGADNPAVILFCFPTVSIFYARLAESSKKIWFKNAVLISCICLFIFAIAIQADLLK